MDIVSFSRAAKVEREVKQARDSHASLDQRLDAISIGNVVSVGLKTELPSTGEEGRLYLVKEDASNQGYPMSYTYIGGSYVKIGGDRVGNHPDNGAITINGTKYQVYTHPTTHSADMLTDGVSKKVMTAEERTKLSNIEEGANRYVHPDTHSADMITDGTERVSMTTGERKKLSIIDPWGEMNDLVDYKDVVIYFAFDEQGRVIRQVVTDNYTEQVIREPVLNMPTSTDGFTESDSFLVVSVGEVYRFDGTDFVQLPSLVDAYYLYDAEGRLIRKTISTLGATPVTINYDFVYDSFGNRIAVKKY